MVLRKKWKYYKAAVLCKYCSNVYKRRHLWIEILEKSRTGGEIPLGAAEDLLFLNFLKLYEEKRSAWLTLKVSALRVFSLLWHMSSHRTNQNKNNKKDILRVFRCVCVFPHWTLLWPSVTSLYDHASLWTQPKGIRSETTLQVVEAGFDCVNGSRSFDYFMLKYSVKF